MNYQHFQYFQVVARTQNYQTAARELYISQSTLSRAIANLEKELDVTLFEKRGRNIYLSPAGEVFLSYVNKAVQNIDEGIQTLKEHQTTLSGTIKISAVYGLMYHQVPEVIVKYNEHYPHVTFEITTAGAVPVIQNVSKGICDIGFHTGSPRMAYFQDIESTQIMSSKLVVICARDHPLASRDAVFLSEIADESFVCFDEGAGSTWYIKNMFQEAGLSLNPQYTVTDDQGLLNLVKTSRVLACIINESVMDSPDVHIIQIKDDVPHEVPIYMSMKKKTSYPPHINTFFNFTRELYKK